MSGFFEEIKRRKVYRAAAAYAVVAAGAIQLASAIFPAWELPSWALRLVIILLLIGFPIALIVAWAVDVTAEGIRATPHLPLTPRRRRNVIALVSIGVIVSIAAGVFLLPRASARRLDKSIAVLPFDSFSEDKENAFFADGIQDDILTNLIQDRRPAGHLAHLRHAVSRQAKERPRNRQGPRRFDPSGRKRA